MSLARDAVEQRRNKMSKLFFVVCLIVVILATPVLAETDTSDEKIREYNCSFGGEIEIDSGSVRPGYLWPAVSLMNDLETDARGGRNFLPMLDSEIKILTKYAVVHEGSWDEQAVGLLTGRQVDFMGQLQKVGSGEGSRTELVWGYFFIHIDRKSRSDE